MGAAASALLGAAVLLHWHEVFDLLRRNALLQAELAVAAGTIGGLLLARLDMNPLLRRRVVALERLYERVATQPVRPVPGYTHYLPCVLLMVDTSGVDLPRVVRRSTEASLLRHGVGGVLYVGAHGVRLAFVPLDESPTSDREVIVMRPLREVTATPVALPQSTAARFVRARPRYAMMVRWPQGQALLAVPSMGDTLARLHNCLDELRWGPAS